MGLEDHKTAIYTAFGVYGAILIVCAYWAYRRMARMEHDGVADKLTSHYLGGKSFGPIITVGTLFASNYSGYTVVGIPNEAYWTGFLVFRWIPLTFSGVLGLYVMTARLRKAGGLRNHNTSVDFITDRFQCQMLRYIILSLQFLTAVIYLAAQVIALKGTFNMIFGVNPDSPVAVICIMAGILLFEWVGGLSSVAITDCVQGFVMLISFIALPIVVRYHYGGWRDFKPEDYPNPAIFRTPTRSQQWLFWQISLIGFGIAMLPHFIQRIYAARDLVSIKAGYLVLGTGVWYTSFASIFVGIIGIIALDGEPTASPITSILGNLCDEGGFSKFLAVVTLTASMAAIMSTADSLIIAISQLITVEVTFPLFSSANPNQIAWCGRLCSLFSTIFALIVGLFWEEGISNLAITQFDLSVQAIPAFWWGLFATEQTDVHPWCICFSTVVATIYVLCFNYLYLQSAEEPLAINAGFSGFWMQIVIIITLDASRRWLIPKLPLGDNAKTSKAILETGDESVPELLFKERPRWDIPTTSKYGVHSLSPRFLWKMMDGVNEPMTNRWFIFLFFFCVTMISPMAPGGEPEDLDAINTFNGLPWWIFKSIMLSIVPTVLFLCALYQMPNEFPKNDAVDSNNLNDKKAEGEVITSESSSSTSGNPFPGAVEEAFEGVNIEDAPLLRRRGSIRRILEQHGVPPTVIEQELAKSSSAQVAPFRIGGGTISNKGDSVEIH